MCICKCDILMVCLNFNEEHDVDIDVGFHVVRK